MIDPTLHAAAVIRLNVTTTALELAAYSLRDLIADAPEDESLDAHRDTLAMIRAAIEIARGHRSDVPAPLRERSTLDVMYDTAAIRRFLSAA
jgi:hypothetical protein